MRASHDHARVRVCCVRVLRACVRVRVRACKSQRAERERER